MKTFLFLYILFASQVCLAGTGRIIDAAIADNADIHYSKMQSIASHNFLGNTSGSSGAAAAMTPTQSTALLNAMVGDSGSGGTKGMCPAPASGDAAAGAFLSAHGDYRVPSSGSGATDIAYVPAVSGNWSPVPSNVASGLDQLAVSVAIPYVKADGTRGLSGNWNAGSHSITATTFIGALTGNSSTSSALASDPTDCASDTYATTIAANGNLTCSSVSDTGLAVSYIKADGSRGLSGDWNAGAHSITATTFVGALTGNASTATALASNPSDCASDTYATTIAVSGNLTCSTVSDAGLASGVTTAGAASSIAKFDANGNLNIAGDRAPEDPRNMIHIHADFNGYLDVWDPGKDPADTRGCSGTSCISVPAGGAGSVIDNGHPGIAPMGTGTSTTGSAWMGSGNTMVFGGGTTRLEWLMYHPTLSDVTNTYTEAMGYIDAFSVASDCTTNGLFVTYTDGTNSGNFVFHACNNGSKSTTNCTFGPTAAAWNRYDITTNAAGTSASFQLNDGSACTIATNIPNVQGRNTVLGYWSIVKSAGASDRRMNIDYADFYMKFTTPR